MALPQRCSEDLRCKITLEERRKLDKYAKKYDISISAIIRYLIDEKLEDEEC